METLIREQAATAVAAAASAITTDFDEAAYKARVAEQFAEIRANYTPADKAFAAAYEELVYG